MHPDIRVNGVVKSASDDNKNISELIDFGFNGKPVIQQVFLLTKKIFIAGCDTVNHVITGINFIYSFTTVSSVMFFLGMAFGGSTA